MSGKPGRVRAGVDMMYEEMAKDCVPYTHFNVVECIALMKMHNYLSANEAIDRMRFRSILYAALEITDSFMLDRIYRIADKNDDGIIDAYEWVFVLSTLLRGTLQEMTEFCYSIYDINGDRSLAHEELLMCFEGSFKARGDMAAEEIPDCLQDLVQLAMAKLDVDKDGIITFSDYKAAVENDPLLLQICGVCLPPCHAIKGFQYVFTWNYNHFYTPYIQKSSRYELKNRLKSTLGMPFLRTYHHNDFVREIISDPLMRNGIFTV